MVLGAGSLCKQADHREPTFLELVVYHVEIIEEFFPTFCPDLENTALVEGNVVRFPCTLQPPKKGIFQC